MDSVFSNSNLTKCKFEKSDLLQRVPFWHHWSIMNAAKATCHRPYEHSPRTVEFDRGAKSCTHWLQSPGTFNTGSPSSV